MWKCLCHTRPDLFYRSCCVLYRYSVCIYTVGYTIAPAFNPFGTAKPFAVLSQSSGFMSRTPELILIQSPLSLTSISLQTPFNGISISETHHLYCKINVFFFFFVKMEPNGPVWVHLVPFVHSQSCRQVSIWFQTTIKLGTPWKKI